MAPAERGKVFAGYANMFLLALLIELEQRRKF
jgi:hypothetical protein